MGMTDEQQANLPNTSTSQSSGVNYQPTYQPIAPQSSGGSSFGSGTLTGAGTGALIGHFLGPGGTLAGAAIGAGIGFIGDLANLWIGADAAKKSEEQTRKLNAESELQYNKENAVNAERYKERVATAKKATDWSNYKDRTSMLGSWTGNLFALADKDENVKNAMVNLWRSKQ